MKIFVAGCGTMGAGIVQTFAVHGHEVVMYTIRETSVERAYGQIEKKLQRQVDKERMTADERDSAIGRITKSTNIEDAKDADLVVETIVEKLQPKREFFEQIDKITSPDCLFGSNTSSLSITEIANGLDHEANFLGFHFFNPAPIMKLIEITKGSKTSDDAVAKAREISEAIGKTPVLVQESPGFVVNRVLIPMINEAIILLEQNVASAEDIDTAMKLGANHPMGPLELADLIGLDICLDIMNVLYNETCDSKYRPSLLLKKKVRAGELGRKSGVGFHCYK